MLSPAWFCDLLTSRGIDLFAGVPDSLLKDLCAYITDHVDPRRNVITGNEGMAVALAAGHHLATGSVGAVYMQNSGLGNAVNPLVSLVDPKVYAVPVLLLIGWRGEPGRKDEPQHVTQGAITLPLLETLRIPHEVLPEEPEPAEEAVDRAMVRLREGSAPVALVIRAGTFAAYHGDAVPVAPYALRREDAIRLVLDRIGTDGVIVSTTGKTSRELFELREQRGEGHERDFLTVGSMGHASQIALGLALARPELDVWCLDGDGAAIMHLGSLATVGQLAPANLRHIVINNGAHDSVGGQPTAAFGMDLPAIARACRYRSAACADDPTTIPEALDALRAAPGPSLLEIRVSAGAREDLARPTSTPVDNKHALMRLLASVPGSASR
jgi:phosphonopyruvate decarboxylase